MNNTETPKAVKFFYRTAAFALVSTTLGLAQSSSKPAPTPQDAQSAFAPAVNLDNLFSNPYAASGVNVSFERVPQINVDDFANPFKPLADKFKADAEAWKLQVNGGLPPRELLKLSPAEKDAGISKRDSPHTYHVGLILMTESIHVFGTQKYIGDNGALKPFNDGNLGGILYWGGNNVDYFIGEFRSSVRQAAWGGGIEGKKRFKLGSSIVMNVGGLFAALPNGYRKQRIADPIEPGAGAVVVELLSYKFPFKNDVDRLFAKIPGMDGPTRKCYSGVRAMVVPPGNNGSLVFNAELKVGCSVTHLKPR